MWWFLFRAAVFALAVYFVYLLATGGYRQVKRYYSWMHPVPAAVQ